MSALPFKADMLGVGMNVRFVPAAVRRIANEMTAWRTLSYLRERKSLGLSRGPISQRPMARLFPLPP